MQSSTEIILHTTSNNTLTATTKPVSVNWYYSARFWVSFGTAGALLNVLEAIFIYFRRRQKTVYGLTLASLCAADILGSICFIIAGALRLHEYSGPLTVKFHRNTALHSSWSAGHAALFFSVGTSFVHITIIAVQRLFVVLWPIAFKTWFTRKRCAILLAITWISFFLSGAVGYFFVQGIWTASYYLMLVVGAILVICYTVICSKTWRAAKKRQLIAVSVRRTSDVEKTVLLSLSVTIAFLVCTCPQSIFYLIVLEEQDLTFYHLVNSMISVNPFLDAVIYFCFYHDCSSKTNTKQEQTYSTPVTKKHAFAPTPETLRMKAMLASREELRASVPSVTI